MTGRQLELNLEGISNQKELEKLRKQQQKEISNDAEKKLGILLDLIIAQKKYTKKDLKKIASLSKWINEI